MVRDCMVWYGFTLRSLRYVACATLRCNVPQSAQRCVPCVVVLLFATALAVCATGRAALPHVRCVHQHVVCATSIQVNQWLMLFNGMLSCIDALAHEVPSSVAYAAVAHTSSTHSAKATHRPGCHLTESFQTERPINRTRVRASNRRLSTGLPLYYSE